MIRLTPDERRATPEKVFVESPQPLEDCLVGWMESDGIRVLDGFGSIFCMFWWSSFIHTS